MYRMVFFFVSVVLSFWMTGLEARGEDRSPLPVTIDDFGIPERDTRPVNLRMQEPVTKKQRSIDDMFLSDREVELSPKEIQALRAARSWREGDLVQVNPVFTPDGAVEYMHGAEQPSIVCAVWQLTVIKLQEGEQVKSVSLGDTHRWWVDVVAAGDTTLILIKPKDIGLETNMVISTDRRGYLMRLRSHRTEYVPLVKFSYLEDVQNKLTSIRTQLTTKREEATIPETNEYLGDLDFGYEIVGKVPWKPVRVFNDSNKTIIELPPSIKNHDFPAFFSVRKDGGIFRKEQIRRENVRVHNGRITVDSVFDKGVLIAGAGRTQERVYIIKKKGRRR